MRGLSDSSWARRHRAWVLAAVVLFLSASVALAATKPVDLDTVTGAESKCDLNVLSSFPVTVEDVVTNSAVGDAFNFSWPSAGPGGFTSSVAPGTPPGVGARWTWSTNQTIYAFTGSACTNDICFLKTVGPDPLQSTCSLGCFDDGVAVTVSRGTAGNVNLTWSGRGIAPYTIARSLNPATISDPANVVTTTSQLQFADVTPSARIVYYQVRGATCFGRKPCGSNADCAPATEGICLSRGPFAVPGRSLLATDVTVSAASLTSSLITFFSPPHVLFRMTSVAQPGGVLETYTNRTNEPVTVVSESGPPGCCDDNPEVPHQMRCGDTCVDYLNDPQNCGACGHVCQDGTCCTYGYCASLCDEGWTWCNGACVNLASDNDNCNTCGNSCEDGSCCYGGVCASFCGDGETNCGEGGCAHLENNNINCGECGHVCQEGFCCNGGSCESLCEGRTWCDGACVDFDSDSENCGGCGDACEEGSCCYHGECVSECPAGSYCDGYCYDLQHDDKHCGSCDVACEYYYYCDDGVCREGKVGGLEPQGEPAAVCPNPHPTHPEEPASCGAEPYHGGGCPNPYPTYPEEGQCPGDDYLTRGGFPDSPLCQVPSSSETIPPGGSSTTCRPGGLLFKEVPAIVSVCGDSMPGPDGVCRDSVSKVSSGTFMRLAQDTETEVGNAYITPYAVHVVGDTSGDGLIEPGEQASLLVEVLNAGPLDVVGASATLSSYPIDLTLDESYDPVDLTILAGSSPYGTIQGTPTPHDCESVELHPASNSILFQVSPPLEHPGDTAHPLVLQFTGTVGEAPFTMDVPFNLGIADKCSHDAATRDFDGLEGLLAPMARLVPRGEELPISGYPFLRGQTLPLKLRLSCGGVELAGGEVDPPEIVELWDTRLGPIDPREVITNESVTFTANDLLFRWNEQDEVWDYDMSTSILSPGTYMLTIRIAGRKDYITGFVLH